MRLLSNNRGVSLVELIVSLGIVAFSGLIIEQMITSLYEQKNQLEKSADMQDDQLIVFRQLTKYFNRATVVKYTHIPISGFQTSGNYYSIRKNGSVLVEIDSSICEDNTGKPVFKPALKSSPITLTYLGLVCCDVNTVANLKLERNKDILLNTSRTNPVMIVFPQKTIRIKDYCPKGGLVWYEKKGTVERTQCYSNIKQMDSIYLGKSTKTNSDAHQLILKSNVSQTQNKQTFDTLTIENILSVGNNGLAEDTLCSEEIDK